VTAVRCALIGVGLMGADHAAILGTSAAADLAVACDLDPSVASRLPPDTAFTTDMETALATPGLEAVLVATPPGHHLAAVRAAVERRLAVFCEKPIAGSLADADEIVRLAASAPRPVVIGHVMRFDPRYRALQDAVSAGHLGPLVQVSIRTLAPAWQGVLLGGRVTLAVEMAVHGLDVLRWLAGDIERVHAEQSATGVAGDGRPDALSVTIRFLSGAVGTLDTNWAIPSETGAGLSHHFMAVGADGLAWIDGRDAGTAILSTAATPRFPLTWSHADPAGAMQGVVRTEVEHFLRIVRDNGAWPVTASDARAALAAALAVDRSIAEGRPIRVAEME